MSTAFHCQNTFPELDVEKVQRSADPYFVEWNAGLAVNNIPEYRHLFVGRVLKLYTMEPGVETITYSRSPYSLISETIYFTHLGHP